jgi:hypothetical protein
MLISEHVSNDEHVSQSDSHLIEKKSPSLVIHSHLAKHRSASSIPQEPVSMHRTVQLSMEPLDIQFGDVQWNDSIPVACDPSDDIVQHQALLSSTDNHHEQQYPSE